MSIALPLTRSKGHSNLPSDRSAWYILKEATTSSKILLNCMRLEGFINDVGIFWHVDMRSILGPYGLTWHMGRLQEKTCICSKIMSLFIYSARSYHSLDLLLVLSTSFWRSFSDSGWWKSSTEFSCDTSRMQKFMPSTWIFKPVESGSFCLSRAFPRWTNTWSVSQLNGLASCPLLPVSVPWFGHLLIENCLFSLHFFFLCWGVRI